MRNTAWPVLLLALSSTGWAQDLQLFNPSVLGHSPTQPTVLLLEKNAPGDIQPSVVSLDTMCGRYVAASTYYQKPVTMSEVRTMLNRVYASAALKKSAGTLWRVEREHFAIQLVDGGDDGVRVIYLHFAPTTQEIFKDLAKSKGAKDVPEPDCAAWDRMFAAEAPSEAR